MYGGTTGRHVARHGADPAPPGGAPVDPTLGHDMFQCPRPVRVHGGPERPRSARASVRASGSSFSESVIVLFPCNPSRSGPDASVRRAPAQLRLENDRTARTVTSGLASCIRDGTLRQGPRGTQTVAAAICHPAESRERELRHEQH